MHHLINTPIQGAKEARFPVYMLNHSTKVVSVLSTSSNSCLWYIHVYVSVQLVKVHTLDRQLSPPPPMPNSDTLFKAKVDRSSILAHNYSSISSESLCIQCSKPMESKFPIFALLCVSLLVSLEMQVQEGPNLVHMYRRHCLLCIAMQ